MSPLEAATLAGLGLLIGSFGTLIGAGGGFLIVPLLLLAYGFAPPDAVGTSLTIVFLNALSGTIAYLRQRRVDLALGVRFAAATVPGAVGGAYLTRSLSSYGFSLAFGVLLLAIAGLLLAGKAARPSARAAGRALIDASGAAHLYRIDAWKGVLLSFGVGFASSVFGLGGGIIHVPFLVVALGLPVHVATATSHFVLSISTLIGAGTFFHLGHVKLATVAWMGAGVLAGAQLGAQASLRASDVLIRRLLGGALALVAVRMIAHAVGLASMGGRP